MNDTLLTCPTNLTTTRYIMVPQNAIITDKTIQFIIASPIEFINQPIIKPYSSTRTRYELSPVLDCTVIRLHSYNHSWSYDPSYPIMFYKVCIKKTPRALLSRTSKLFIGSKFDISLELWCPPQKSLSQFINDDTILSQLPYQYGEISISQSCIPARRYKTGIVIPFYSRSEYVAQFLESLINSNLSDCLIIMVDESLTKDVNIDHRMVHKQVDEFELDERNKYTPVIKIFKYIHGNMNDSILRGLDILYTYCDTLSTIDSDTIHNIDWLPRLHVALKEATDPLIKPQNSNILISGFNVESERHSVVSRTPEYIVKTSVGGCHMMFSSTMYIEVIRPCLVSHKWDSNIVSNINHINRSLINQESEPKYKIITTNPSVIQHIGISTSIQIRKGENTWDYAKDFKQK